MGVDLMQEPFKAAWGYPGTAGSVLNWNEAAKRLGDHVLEHCPRWLVFVQGISSWPGAYHDDGNPQTFYGENLRGALKLPIMLRNPRKLVYSPHICECATIK